MSGRNQESKRVGGFENWRWQTMNTIAGHRYIPARDNAIQREDHFLAPRPPRGKAIDLRCPDCNSSALKRVSLAHEEGLFRTTSRSRLRGFLLGENGPNLVVG